MKKIFLMVFILPILLQCRKKSDTTEPHVQTEEEHLDYAYGTHYQQTMDVYIPEGVRDTMTMIVMIHGGSWVSRDKSDFAAWYNYEKQQKHFALANINYRLDTQQTLPIPMQTDDIGLAIQKMENVFGIRSGKIVLIGMSAGGHLALLYAYKYDTHHQVKVVINMVGPADFTDPSYHQGGAWADIFPYIEIIFNAPYAGNENYYMNVSPYYFIDNQSPATISGYAGMDTIVPYTNGERIHQKLQQFNIPEEYVFYPNSGHVFNQQDGLDFFWRARTFMLQNLQ